MACPSHTFTGKVDACLSIARPGMTVDVPTANPTPSIALENCSDGHVLGTKKSALKSCDDVIRICGARSAQSFVGCCYIEANKTCQCI